MHADICSPTDADALDALRDALKALGASHVDDCWAIGVEQRTYSIGSERLTIFSDAWSVDAEGPDDLVSQLLSMMRRRHA